MRNLLNKELFLSSSKISYLFILFGAMAMIPGYPILVGPFFVCFGIFQTFQSGRENNDILYTVLLPVRKTDAVRAKFAFAVIIQMAAFLLETILTILRMLVFSEAVPYVNNAMMNANQIYLAWSLVIFAIFNYLFIGGYFKTAYKFAGPFVTFLITAFVVIIAAEVLHHIPGLTFLNSTSPIDNGFMWGTLAAGALIYGIVTLAACKVSVKRFEKVDL